MVALLPLALAGGGLLAGRTLAAPRARRRFQSISDAILRGEGADAQLAGPPLPLELQEARRSSVVSPLQAQIAAAMTPRQAAEYLQVAAAPNIERRRQERELARQQAVADSMVLPENRQLAIMRGMQAGAESIPSIDERDGTLTDIALPGSDDYRDAVSTLRSSGRALDEANIMASNLMELAADPTFAGLDILNTGDERVGRIQGQGSNLLLELRQVFPGMGELDTGTERLFSGLGINLNDSDIDNVGNLLRLLQSSPEATLSRLDQLRKLLAYRAGDALYEAEILPGVRPVDLETARNALQEYDGRDRSLDAPGRQSPATAYDMVLGSEGLREMVERIVGSELTNAVMGESTSQPTTPQPEAAEPGDVNSAIMKTALSRGSGGATALMELAQGNITGAVEESLRAGLGGTAVRMLQALQDYGPEAAERLLRELTREAAGRAAPQ